MFGEEDGLDEGDDGQRRSLDSLKYAAKVTVVLVFAKERFQSGGDTTDVTLRMQDVILKAISSGDLTATLRKADPTLAAVQIPFTPTFTKGVVVQTVQRAWPTILPTGHPTSTPSYKPYNREVVVGTSITLPAVALGAGMCSLVVFLIVIYILRRRKSMNKKKRKIFEESMVPAGSKIAPDVAIKVGDETDDEEEEEEEDNKEDEDEDEEIAKGSRRRRGSRVAPTQTGQNWSWMQRSAGGKVAPLPFERERKTAQDIFENQRDSSSCSPHEQPSLLKIMFDFARRRMFWSGGGHGVGPDPDSVPVQPGQVETFPRLAQHSSVRMPQPRLTSSFLAPAPYPSAFTVPAPLEFKSRAALSLALSPAPAFAAGGGAAAPLRSGAARRLNINNNNF